MRWIDARVLGVGSIIVIIATVLAGVAIHRQPARAPLDQLRERMLACGPPNQASGNFAYEFWLGPDGRLKTDPNVQNFDALLVGRDGDAFDAQQLVACFGAALAATPFPRDTAPERHFIVPVWFGCNAHMPCGPERW